MLKIKHIIFGLVLSSTILTCAADDLLGVDVNPKNKRRKGKTSWIFGAGWNAVDDNGSPFKKLFAVKQGWSLPWYPSQGSAEIIGDYGLTFGATFSYNRYKSGKTINSEIISGKYSFFALDGFTKYHFKEHIKMNPRFDPYFSLGAGYTLRFIAPYNSVFTLNAGFGTNVWLNNYWGLNFQSLAKFGLRSPFFKTGSNYLHHSIGVVFMLDNSPRKKHSFIKPRYKWVHDNHKIGERLR